mmetsp:Transcript_24315/g.4055  ORF Transcript_24315/g.4055 Transcript_24315/m.4055 type:complete len:93 (+) Transcript_24315:651-929(+)
MHFSAILGTRAFIRSGTALITACLYFYGSVHARKKASSILTSGGSYESSSSTSPPTIPFNLYSEGSFVIRNAINACRVVPIPSLPWSNSSSL